MKNTRYCTGIKYDCQHWGIIPVDYHDLTHTLKCPICKGYMGPVGYTSPVEDTGYKESDKVTPLLVNERTF
jgi:hypothetical protein